MKLIFLIAALFFVSTFASAQEENKKSNYSPTVSLKEGTIPQQGTIEYWDYYIYTAEKKIEYLKADPVRHQEAIAKGKIISLEKAIASGKEERLKLINASTKKE